MTEDDEKFFERLRGDAAPLRYRVDEATLTRIRARIQDRIARPTVVQLLAAWFRPLAAGLAAVALVAAIGLTAIDSDETVVDDYAIEIAGDTYVVGD